MGAEVVVVVAVLVGLDLDTDWLVEKAVLLLLRHGFSASLFVGKDLRLIQCPFFREILTFNLTII